MLRTNLATRPFYNERVVHLALALAALAVLAISVADVANWLSLRRRHADLVGQVSGAESRATQLQQDAQRLRRSLSRTEVEAVSKAASEANALIDRRTFSWTGLLGHFESTLPAEVRILAVSPRIERDGEMTVRIVVVARQAEDVDAFVGKLEATRAFAGLLSHEEVLNRDGMLEVTLEGRYLGTMARPPAGAQ